MLSTEWLGNNTKLLFEFADGRQFSMTPGKLKDRGWPQKPDYYFKQVNSHAKTDEDKLKSVREIAMENNGKLLSTKWLGLLVKHEFEFADGRIFNTTPDYLLKNGWPQNPEIYFKIVTTKEMKKDYTKEERLNELAIIAEENGGKLLSTEWLGTRESYLFKFDNGEKFTKTGDNIKRQGWPQDRDKYLQKYRK